MYDQLNDVDAVLKYFTRKDTIRETEYVSERLLEHALSELQDEGDPKAAVFEEALDSLKLATKPTTSSP